MRLVPVEVKDTDDQVTVRAEVPGFAANEIKISVEPKSLVISGKSEKATEVEKQQTVLSEFRSNQFWRELTFPAEIEPAKTTATLEDGILELILAKTVPGKVIDFEVKTA